ncbi:MAG TPA: NBR1-Ig-like domain-containing protein [Anaerolineales bacterium]|jgi:hypothetical protein
MNPKLRNPILVLTVIGMMMMACNLTAGGAAVDETAAVQTVEAELTRIALAEPSLEATESLATEAPTATLEPTATESGPTPTAGTLGCTDRATFVSDVSVPDGSNFDPGDNFTKTWRLRNDGTCTWTSSYALVFDHGDAMGAPAAIPLAGAVPPGNNVDLSVNLTAPAAPGGYQGFFLLRNNSNVLFGIGPSATTAFWVKIDVVPPSPTPTATTFFVFPIITLIPLFAYSNGSDQVLNDGACFDLDEGNPIGCGSGDADFRYDATIAFFPSPSEQNFEPLHDAEGRYIAANPPAKADCQGLALLDSEFDLDSGDNYCYETSDGRYGYIHVDTAGLFSLTFDWWTWN